MPVAAAGEAVAEALPPPARALLAVSVPEAETEGERLLEPLPPPPPTLPLPLATGLALPVPPSPAVPVAVAVPHPPTPTALGVPPPCAALKVAVAEDSSTEGLAAARGEPLAPALAEATLGEAVEEAVAVAASGPPLGVPVTVALAAGVLEEDTVGPPSPPPPTTCEGEADSVSPPRNPGREGEGLGVSLPTPHPPPLLVPLGLPSSRAVPLTLGVAASGATVVLGVGCASLLLLPDRQALLEAEAQALAAALLLTEPVSVPLTLALLLSLAVLDWELVLLALPVPVEVLEGLAVRVAGEALEQADGLGELLAVLLPCVGVAVVQGLAEAEAVSEALPLPPWREREAEGEVAGLLLPLPLMLELPEGEAVVEALTVEEGEREGERLALLLRVAVAPLGEGLREPRTPEGVEVGVERAVTDTKGMVNTGEVEGRGLGVGRAVGTMPGPRAAPAVRPVPCTSPMRSRPEEALLLLLLLLPSSSTAVWPCSPKNSCLGCAVAVLALYTREVHSCCPVAAATANMAPLLPRKPMVPLLSDMGGSSTLTPTGRARLHTSVPWLLSRACSVCCTRLPFREVELQASR